MPTSKPRSTLGDDSASGLTLVELIIALFIVSLAFVALASTAISSFTAISNNQARVQATALGSEAVEEMATIPWADLGLWETTAPAVDFEGEPVVLLPTDDPGVRPEPVSIVELTEGDYTIERWVTWVDEDGGPDLKRMIARVSWEVGGRSFTMRTEGLRSPDPDDLRTLEILSFEMLPDIVELNSPSPGGDDDDPDVATNAQRFDGEVRVGDIKASVTMSFRDRGGNLRVLTAPGVNEEEERSFPINFGDWSFVHGPVPFVVTATGPDGEIASDSRTVRFLQDLEVRSINVTHSAAGTNVIALDLATCQVPDGEITITSEVWGMGQLESGPDTEGNVTVSWPGSDAPELGFVERTRSGGWFEESFEEATTVFPGTYSAGQEVTFTVDVERVIEAAGPEPEPWINVITSFEHVVVFSASVEDCP